MSPTLTPNFFGLCDPGKGSLKASFISLLFQQGCDRTGGCSACLASTKPWVRSPVLRNKTRVDNLMTPVLWGCWEVPVDQNQSPRTRMVKSDVRL
jgi:hypothetical protein